MTDEMLELARANAAEAGVGNVGVRQGVSSRRSLLADHSVDAIVSNCVLNLSGDKPKVFFRAGGTGAS